MTIFFDSQTHLDFPIFENDLNNVLSHADAVGVKHFIVSSTTAQRWNVIKHLTTKYPMCLPAYGLHPMFMNEHKPEHLDQLKRWIDNEKPAAIGEIGLDFFIKDHNKKAQEKLFIAQLDIANDVGLPVIIHARKSVDIILKHLRRFPLLTGSIHSFSGSEQQAKQLIENGFYLGFGGPITYTRATKLRKLVQTLPLENLLLETDSPDLPDALHNNERNEPAYLPIIAKTIAELRGVDIEEVARITTLNAENLFRTTAFQRKDLLLDIKS